MSGLPSAIVFVNNDLTDNVTSALIRQLFISQVLDGYVFDGYVAQDVDFLSRIKRNNLRVMVVRSFQETTNRNLADLVLFVKLGLASVLLNKFGPPDLTLPVTKLYWGILGFY